MSVDVSGRHPGGAPTPGGRTSVDSADADRLYSPPRRRAESARGSQLETTPGEILLAAKTASFRPLARACAQTLAAAALTAGTGIAQAQEPGLEEVIVTATRRAENMQEVPISVSALEGARMEALFEGGDDIRALATRVPSLYAESSNGRISPRFYIRGLGNTDFDLAASQPVSIIVDEVVLENVVLKSSPLFDLERVEVLRGPQGTLFGRNTPAGIVKFDTVKPSQEFDADVSLSYGELDSVSAQGAIGGGLTDTVSGRVAVLYQSRGDWIDNDFLGESDAIGGFDELAWRAQLLLEPTESFSALLNVHGRDNDGTASIFRANVLGPGSDGFNSNYDRDAVTYDWDGQARNNPQSAEGIGASLRLDFDFDGDTTLTSITAYENAESKSLGDIDGGFGADFLPFVGPCPPGSTAGVDPCIPFPSTSQDGIDDLDQFTQEVRLQSQASDDLFWQAGVYYFDSKFSVTTHTFIPNDLTADPADLFAPTTVTHENTAWAVFGHLSYDVTDALTISGGLRYTDDDKDMSAVGAPLEPILGPVAPVSVSDEQVSGDVNLLYRVSDSFNVYGRYARGFRAPTIQGRDVAFFGNPSVADSETIDSIEGGFKSQLADNRVRLNGAVFYYEVKDMQLSAIGGTSNLVQLINADKGTGVGFEVDGEFLLTDRLLVTAGFSYVDTEIEDSSLTIPGCGSGMCTELDPEAPSGNLIVDGNPFPQAPEYIATLTARYGIPVGDDGEFFLYTDWALQGDTNFFIYEAAEFKSSDTFEGGLRIGYSMNDGQYEIALFGRNITDEENVKGAIDFNNLTGFDNEPRVVGVSFRARFD
jgi:iron complex outermembrane receptor protein